MVTAAPPVSAPEQFARIIDGLCRAIAARGVGGRLTSALLMLLWNRLRRTALRVHRLAARLAAGPLVIRQRPASPRPDRPPPLRLPRGHAWLMRLVPGLAGYRSQLEHLLADPEMEALANAPPMRRLLRPLCQMLGLPPPPIPSPAVTAAAPQSAAIRPPPHPTARPGWAAPVAPVAPAGPETPAYATAPTTA